MNDEKILERARDWVRREVVGMTYRYEVPSDDGKRIQACFTSSIILGSELLAKPLQPKSWVRVHSISIMFCEIEERDKDSALVSVEAMLFKSKGDKEGEGEGYKEGASYLLRVYDADNIELLN